jgi:peptide/nickel transport system ATP-binding protein
VTTALLHIENLQVRFDLREGAVTAIHDLSLAVPAGKVVALVGESGCGKSVTAKAILGLLPATARITNGKILLSSTKDEAAVDIASLSRTSRALRSIRGKRISMIFQEPMASLSPVHTIGDQIAEIIRLHQRTNAAKTREQVLEILRLVSIPSPEQRMKAYPHEMSGGLRQRAMIAMALACRPELVIADEPTTALDVTLQAQILDLLRDLQRRLGMAILMITHDLGVVAQIADEVAVMYNGRIVEKNTVAEIFRNPRHPYTVGLLESVPRVGQGNKVRLASIPGSVPGPFATIEGCPFHPRCTRRINGVCDVGAAPPLTLLPDGASVACHLYPTDAVTGVGAIPREVVRL